MERITLVCWSCGKSKDAEVPQLPQFAFEVASIADAIGMHGILDVKHHRSLVFCDVDCVRPQLTRTGELRLRPRRLTTTE